MASLYPQTTGEERSEAEMQQYAGVSYKSLEAGEHDTADEVPLLSDNSEGATQDDSKHPTWRTTIFVTMPIFMGYAALNALQRKVKLQLGIPDDQSPMSHEFGVAVSFLYVGNLIFRLMHNVVFAPFVPRQRVYISYLAMALSMLSIALFIFVLDSTKTIAFVFVSYLLGGVGIGSFESNVMTSITPLGHGTKTWAVLGLPIGYNIINIGSMALISIDPTNIWLQVLQYMIVLVFLLIGFFVFKYHIPQVEVTEDDHKADDLKHFVGRMRSWREWFPIIKWNCLALMLDMACVSLFSSVAMYIFDMKRIPLFGMCSPGSRCVTMEHNGFLAIYNACAFLGDTLSRKVIYNTKPRSPLLFLLFSLAGVLLCLSKVAILALPGIFMIFWANGSIYATTTRHVDSHVSAANHLVAMSIWLFVGDIGSVTGSNLTSYMYNWVNLIPHPS